eukprot:TRINITY_DN15612_c0_g2_i2.p1 TRINITY_DN15612_c0_g2~~TRINITY_DN15612_c0_g2_i2.p1  ORF type:complete len:719 (-),score=280.67 TRINITY_DN15612_c0_g2_i2:64-2058(-)
MESEIIHDGEESQKIYEEVATWCKDRSREVRQAIKTANAQLETAKAEIERATDQVDSLSIKIEELSASVSKDETDLREATAIRNKEAKDFKAAEGELTGAISSLNRAVAIVQKTGAKTDEATASNLLQTLSVLVDASSIGAEEADGLSALLQSGDGEEAAGGEDLEEASARLLGAPASAAYESHSGGLVQTLEGLGEKARAKLDETRRVEREQRQDFELLRQSLQDKIKVKDAQLEDAKKRKGEAAENKATGEKSAGIATKDVAANTKQLGDMHHDCMNKATEYEEETESRGEELKALAEAKKVIQETTGGAKKEMYGGAAAASFLQVASSEQATSGTFKALRFLKKFSRAQKSQSLAQLASRVDAFLRSGDSASEGSEGVFGKVKGLITDMIGKLEEEAGQDATQKAYCDKELAETSEAKADKNAAVEKLSTRIDTSTSTITKLSQEIANLQKQLSELAMSQAEMNKLRQEQKAQFTTVQAHMKEGIEGVQKALKVLREYYGESQKSHDESKGAGGGIISLLEVAESDFSKALSEAVAEEDQAKSAYEEETKENEVTKATKEQDVVYKTKESTELKKVVSELSSDLDGAQSELAAVEEYAAKINEQCVAKAEPYEERKKRREEEMKGLQEALNLLSSDAPEALLQESSSTSRTSLRGVRRHLQ